MDNRRYPNYPLASVSGIVVSQNGVLLIKRLKPPSVGFWSIPGGAVEVGENQIEAVVREVREEGGIESEVVSFLNTKDIIVWDSEERIEYQYMVNRYLLRAKSMEIKPGKDEECAGWFSLNSLPQEKMSSHIVELFESYSDCIELLMKQE